MTLLKVLYVAFCVSMGVAGLGFGKLLAMQLAPWWHRRQLRVRVHAAHAGYAWAMSMMHRGEDPLPYIHLANDFSHIGAAARAFDKGALEAMHDFTTTKDANAMWARAAEGGAADGGEVKP